MLNFKPSALTVVLALCAIATTGRSPAYAQPLTFEADVRPILKTHCFQCHGEAGEREAGLDLRLRRFLVKGGESGAAIVPHSPSDSLLLERVQNGEMPPQDDQQLSAEQITTLKTWIAQGALTARPEPETLEDAPYFTHEERNWWAFQPVKRPPLPTRSPEALTPIDLFLLAKLKQLDHPTLRADDDRGFAPLADRRTLIRRLYLDLLGITPSPDEIDAFLGDSRPAAYQRLVDRVLAAPQYGERWGRHWLDAAGYADSEGYTDEDPERPHAWRYRDYVIRAFNADKPYDQFLMEQLAGDELAGWPIEQLDPATITQLAATGFLRMAPDGTGASGVDQDLARNQVVADTLQIVGTSLMGMTLHCAQCHDHRYDPIPQQDYYQLRAVFEPALNWKAWKAPADRRVSLYTEQDRQIRSEIEARAKVVDEQRQAKVDFYIEKTLEHELLMVDESLQQPLREAFQTPASDRTDAQKQLLEDHTNVGKITSGSLYLYDRRREARAKDLEARRAELLDASLQRIREQALAALDAPARERLSAILEMPEEARTAAQQNDLAQHPAVAVTAETLAQIDPDAAALLAKYDTAASEIRKYRIRDELQKFSDQAQAIRDTIPKEHFLRILAEEVTAPPDTFVFHRGDHQQPREQVDPAGLSVLGGTPLTSQDRDPSTNSSGRRTRFARYLTSGRHPLVARVMVNRIWAHHFGRGIVATTGDFGVLGERPTHPQLLDWLATELVEADWSIKHVQRLIVSSRAYQQSAVATAAVVESDPDNRWLGRWPLRRLEAETLRDVLLELSGQLNAKMYGEPVPVMQDEVGQIVLGKENLDGERKPTKPIPLLGEEFRRSVYIQVRRTRPLSVLESFDLPDLAPHCTDRPSSNVATQALMLMNSQFIVSMSQQMATRLIAAHPADQAAQLEQGWLLTYGRLPSTSERDAAAAFLAKQTAAFASGEEPKQAADAADPETSGRLHHQALATYCQALFGSNRLLYIE